jgi:hypothetical protein
VSAKQGPDQHPDTAITVYEQSDMDPIVSEADTSRQADGKNELASIPGQVIELRFL